MKFVADTHSLLWYLQGSPHLSASSRRLFDAPEKARQVIIPTIVLAELLHIFRKYKTPTTFDHTLKLLEREQRFEIHPLSVDVIREASSFAGLEIHDALITATAIHLDLPLMTADSKISKIIESGLVRVLEP